MKQVSLNLNYTKLYMFSDHDRIILINKNINFLHSQKLKKIYK